MRRLRRASAFLVLLFLLALTVGGCSAIAGLGQFTKDNCADGCEGGADARPDGKVTDGSPDRQRVDQGGPPDAAGDTRRRDASDGGVSGLYTLGGTVTGLKGTGLALTDTLETLAVAADGTFTFTTRIMTGTMYSVTVATQPSAPSQTCTIMGGAGTMGTANVTNVIVTCGVTSYTIGGTVTGLMGTGLELQDNGGDNLLVPGNGPFTFSTPVPSGSPYVVTVVTQPTSPTQTCVVSGGTGTVGSGKVTGVVVNCAADTFTVGGNIYGLAGTVVLQNLGGDNLTLTANGSFAFPTPLASGMTYAVTVLTQPLSPDQTCTVTAGTGTVGSGNVTTVVVNCATDFFTIGGMLSGLAPGDSVVLQDNGIDNLMLSADGPFTFAMPIASGKTYAVTVFTQPGSPISQKCVVSNATGSVTTAVISDVMVTCTTNTFTIGGMVSGLKGSGLVLQDNGGDNLPVATNGSFTFATPLASGTMFSVTVLTQPTLPTQQCGVTGGTGTVAGINVITVSITCATDSFTIGGNITGLTAGASVVLQDNGGDNKSLSVNGPFTFSTSVLSGNPYAVTVFTQPPLPLYCFVTNGSGTVISANVTSVTVTCTPTGCGRFSSGFTGAWSTVSPAAVTQAGMTGYVPAGGAASIYLGSGTSMDQYASGSDSYASLAAPPVSFPSYWSAAWYSNALWVVSNGDVIRYDIPTNAWTTPATGLTTTYAMQTTSDDAGNIWSYSSDSVLIQYNVSSGMPTYHTLSTPLGGCTEPRVTYDSCTGLLYMADFCGPMFYSYDPATDTQTPLSGLPAANLFQDGFCGDRSGHIFAVTNSPTTYQYTIATDTWTAMPSGGVSGCSNSACGVGADGYLYTTDYGCGPTMYRIQLN